MPSSADAQPKTRVLRLVGLPDDHRIEVTFLSPDSDRMRFAYAGSVAVDDLVDPDRFDVVSLLCGDVAGEAGATPRLDVALNAIVDPDRCGQALVQAAAVVDALGIGVVNDPAAVAATRREALAETLAGIDGLIVPPTRRLRPRFVAELLLAVRDGDLQYPFVVGASGGVADAVVVTSAADLPSLDRFAFDGRSFLVTDFHDFRSADGHYRHYGVFVVGGTVARRHLVVADHPTRPGGAWTNRDLDHKLEEDRWIASGAVDVGILRQVQDRLGLDFFGVDYGVLPDGRLLFLGLNSDPNPMRSGGDVDPETASELRDAMSMLLAGRATIRGLR